MSARPSVGHTISPTLSIGSIMSCCFDGGGDLEAHAGVAGLAGEQVQGYSSSPWSQRGPVSRVIPPPDRAWFGHLAAERPADGRHGVPSAAISGHHDHRWPVLRGCASRQLNSRKIEINSEE
jgi:hypothetical protein